jgi:hypothetical protein
MRQNPDSTIRPKDRFHVGRPLSFRRTQVLVEAEGDPVDSATAGSHGCQGALIYSALGCLMGREYTVLIQRNLVYQVVHMSFWHRLLRTDKILHKVEFCPVFHQPYGQNTTLSRVLSIGDDIFP